jgi:hypothetical protein
MTDVQQTDDYEEQPPEGFTLDAEASRTDAVVLPGIVERAVALEPDDDDVAALDAIDDDAHADDGDDDAIDDPDEAGGTPEDV